MRQQGAIRQDQYGTRYATLGFLTAGSATTEKGYGPQPYETFAFDAALLASGIQDFNIVPYSSVLPPGLTIVPIEQVRSSFFHGAVLEVILAQIGFTYSTGPARRNVGIRKHGRDCVIDSDGAVMAGASTIAMQTDVKDASGNVIGGYVTEYVDYFESYVGRDYAQNEADTQLNEAMDQLLERRGLDPNSGKRKIQPVTYIEVNSNQKHGYTMSGLGFLNFENRPPVSPSGRG